MGVHITVCFARDAGGWSAWWDALPEMKAKNAPTAAEALVDLARAIKIIADHPESKVRFPND